MSNSGLRQGERDTGFRCVIRKLRKNTEKEAENSESAARAQTGYGPVRMSKPKLWPEKHWAIGVEIDGEQVVMVAANVVSGRDLSEEERQIVCRAVHHLAAFVGCEELEHG